MARPTGDELQILLVEYGKAQDSAEHHDNLVSGFTALWIGSAVLIGFVLSGFHEHNLAHHKAVLYLVIAVGMAMSVLALVWAQRSGAVKNRKYRICQKIERELGMEQHLNEDRPVSRWRWLAYYLPIGLLMVVWIVLAIDVHDAQAGNVPRRTGGTAAAVATTIWDQILSVSTAVLASATLVLVAGVWLAWRTLIDTRKATQLESYVDLLREYRSLEMLAARKRIHSFDYECVLDDIPSVADREAAERVGHYLDQVGTLIKLDLLDPKPAREFLGGSARNMWEKLEPIVRAERATRARGADYQKHFEYLVDKLDDD